MNPRSLVLFALCALLAGPSLAAGLELTPFVGYRIGGDFDNTSDFFAVDLEADDGESYGLILAFEVTRQFQVELLWSQQESTLLETGGFLGQDDVLFDLDIDYYHAGILYQWSPGQLRPFFTASLGGTRFRPVGDLSDDTRFSMALGGGVKFMANEHFGLRLEARGFATLIEDDDESFCDFGDCYYYDGDDYFTQLETRAGLIFAF